ncbi:hypothetical protein B4117_2139 [Bacillus mycoides]|nr:hypothetical protein B4117_2139 [Bacillus mycoides]
MCFLSLGMLVPGSLSGNKDILLISNSFEPLGTSFKTVAL